MDKTLVQFGDIFRYKEKDFVFLAQTDELLYAALILDDENSERLRVLSDRAETAPRGITRKRSAVFSFVILQTTEFQNRAAHFAKTDSTDHQVFTLEIIGSLCREDIKAIRDEICSTESSVPLKLIEIVKELNITS